jgi:AcrR family transcriptional regulator
VADTRERLLDAASQVLLGSGADQLTLAAVAAEAGVSKGGLFYHFPTKQALVAGLVERLCGRFDTAVATAGDAPGAATRAYLDNTVPPAPPGRDGGAGAAEDRVTAAVLAGLVVDPEALIPLRAAYARWQQRLVTDGIDPAVAVAVRLAVDGWWLARLLDLAAPDDALHEPVRRVLTDLIATGTA